MSTERKEQHDALPIWLRPEPGTRRPRHSREQIAAVALAIADAEGFDAVSMRRVAAELGAGTMTLYHYVRNKDDLVALMDDAIMGELLVPGDLPDGWREALATIARRTRAAFARHPWSLEALRDAQTFGPNGMRHFEQSIAAVDGLGLDVETQLEIIAMVDDYAFGYALREEGALRSPVSDEHSAQALASLTAYIQAQLATGAFPHIQRLFGQADPWSTWERFGALMRDDDRFERGLARLLDGIARDVQRRLTEGTTPDDHTATSRDR